MRRPIKMIIFIIVFALGLLSLGFAEENITITTYYPSPYGSYRELRAQRVAVGENYINTGTYSWDATPATISANADLVAEGTVGIGTTQPITNLDITDSSGVLAFPNFIGIRLNQKGVNKWTGLRFDRDDSQKWFIGMSSTLLDNKIRFRRNGSDDAMVIDDSTGRVSIGGEPNTSVFNFSPSLVEIINPSTFAYDVGLRITKDGDGSAPPILGFYKTRGNIFGGVSSVQDGDKLASIEMGGRVLLGNVGSAVIETVVDADGSIPTSFIPSSMNFIISTQNNPILESGHTIMRIDSTGNVGIGTAESTFGYGLGSPDRNYMLHVVPYNWGLPIPIHTRTIRADGAVKIIPSSNVVLYTGTSAADSEAIWYNGTYFSWGYGGDWNRFADGITIGSATAPPTTGLRVEGEVRLPGLTGVSGGTGKVLEMYTAAGASQYRVYVETSSLRYKENIRDYEVDLNNVEKLRTVRFKWNNKSVSPGAQDIGLIAEEVDKIMPDLVTRDDKGQPDSVRYNRLGVVLLSAFKQQEDKIDAQQKEIDALKAEIKALKTH